MKGKFIWCAILAVVFANHAMASEPINYAVLSLLGDKLLIVDHRMSAGSNIDQNTREYVEVSDAIFDKTALIAVDQSTRRAKPGAEVIFIGATGRELYELQDRLLDRESGMNELLKPIEQLLEGKRINYFILVTKYRHEALLKAKQTSIGNGKLDGLGFYLDRNRIITREDTGERGRGFLAPFAYFKLSLIDVKTMQVIREETALASVVLSAARAKDGFGPWDVLTPRQKSETLQAMLRREISELMPKLLGQ